MRFDVINDQFFRWHVFAPSLYDTYVNKTTLVFTTAKGLQSFGFNLARAIFWFSSSPWRWKQKEPRQTAYNKYSSISKNNLEISTINNRVVRLFPTVPFGVICFSRDSCIFTPKEVRNSKYLYEYLNLKYRHFFTIKAKFVLTKQKNS